MVHSGMLELLDTIMDCLRNVFSSFSISDSDDRSDSFENSLLPIGCICFHPLYFGPSLFGLDLSWHTFLFTFSFAVKYLAL